MSINASLSSDGLEEVFTPPTLKELCLYKCVTNKDILTTEVELNEVTNGRRKLPWEKYRLKEPIQRDLVEALLDAREEFLFTLTPMYEPVLAAIRMSQPEHLVKVNVSNSDTLEDRQLEFLLSGGNVKSLDIHGCESLKSGSLYAINRFGSKLEYLRMGYCYGIGVLPSRYNYNEGEAILTTPNLKTFLISKMGRLSGGYSTNYWRCLLKDFISNLEDLQISGIPGFKSLEFLEPAKTKLTSLSLRDCNLIGIVNAAWASLFKLDKLKSLDLVGTWIQKPLAGENFVQRILTAMPNLTRLAVDPALLKDISVVTLIRGQRSVAKRLEFLGIVHNDAAALRKANLIANDVAHFGTIEGELRMLEYFSNQRLNSGDINFVVDPILMRLLQNLSGVADTPPSKSVTVINLLFKTFNNNTNIDLQVFLFRILKKLLTPDLAAKLGDVLLNHCITAIFCHTRGFSWSNQRHIEIMSAAIDIMMNLDGKHGKRQFFDDYTTLVQTVMQKAEVAMKRSFWLDIGMERCQRFVKKVSQLLEGAVDQFPEETNELWEISSVLGVLKQFKEVTLFEHGNGFIRDEVIGQMDFVEIFNSMIAPVRKMCLNSGARRAAFHYAGGIGIVMELLRDIIDGYLTGLESVALLEILKSIVQDNELDLSESGMIASGLEKHLLSVHSQWEVHGLPNWTNGNEYYFKMQSIANLLNYLEYDPRFDYKASGAVNKIMIKLK